MYYKFGITLLIVASLCFHSNDLKGQSHQALYLELLGNGGLYSFNLDIRFEEQPQGLGARFGMGIVGPVITAPMMINYLMGKNRGFLELGAGFTFLSDDAFIGIGDVDIEQSYGTFSLMYRNQKSEGGFMWKAGFTPIMTRGTFVPFAGVGIGFIRKPK